MTFKQRNTSVDLLKGIAAILIVFIHVRFVGGVGQYICDIARFGVPVFFLTSGFFASTSERKKIHHSILHVCRLIFVAYALNLARIFIDNHCSFSLTIYAIVGICTWKHLLLWLLMNITSISGVSWFLWALLYCYCIHTLLYQSFTNNHLLYVFAGTGFFAGITCTMVLPFMIGKTWGTNNAWMCGLPYYVTGVLINRSEETIRNRFSNIQLVMLAAFGLTFLTIGSFHNPSLCYPGSAVMAISLFCLAVLNPSTRRTILSDVGSEYAFYVYIMHPIFMHVLDSNVNSYGMFLWIRPLIVLMLTLLSAIVFYKIVELVKDVVCE